MEVVMSYVWKQEWAIYGSKNRLYIEVVMSYIWKYEWAIYGSKNELYIELYMEVRMGYI